MPIANRSVEPVSVSQISVPPGVDDHFIYIVNATLSNFIKQIACLSVKANDIFGELASSLNKFVDRTESLEIKIQSINEKIYEFDTSKINKLVNQPVCVYKSHIERDDELLDHTLMPDCIKEMFDEAQKPPDFSQLDLFRKKDEESMKFYTDPDFFLREWLKNARNERKKKREKIKKRKSSNLRRKTMQPPLPPPLAINTVVEEAVLDTSTLDYNYVDVAVYEDPTMFNVSNDTNRPRDVDGSQDVHAELPDNYMLPKPPPPPIITNFPTCLPPAPPPQPLKAPLPTVSNLLADIQRGAALKPASARVVGKEVNETKEKSRDFREFIKELRPAWENQSDDSDDSDDFDESDDD